MAQATLRANPKALDAIFPALLFVLLMLVAVRGFAASVTLAWDPVTNAALSGYMVYSGPTAGNYTSKIDVGNTTTRAVSNLVEGATYHFAVTAYDAAHVESGFSNDVAATIPSAAPVANFSASATSGVAPLAMNFTNSSTGSISSYAWIFGDGTTSTVQSPSHVYSVAGVYTVSLTVSGSGGTNTKTIPNYVTVTASGDTSPPIAPSSLAAIAGGSTGINLTWGASTDNVGVTGYRIERCQGTGCTTFVQIATSTGTTFSDTSLAGSTSFSYRVRATDAAGNLSAYSNTASATTTAVVGTSGALSGTWAASSGTADLTSTGTSDWVQWPASTRKASGGGQISGLTPIGGSTSSYIGDPRTMTWSDGMPAATGSTTTGVSMSGIGKGFQITAPADTTTRTLTVYIGAQNGIGRLTAHLSDGSATDYVSSLSAGRQRSDGIYTLTYQAASAGQTITVSWILAGGSKASLSAGGGRSGNVSIQGASLSSGSVALPPLPTTSCPCSLWSSSAVPTVAADGDPNPQDLGVKFQSDVAGSITGIRFYKSTTNTGTHVGSLWSSNGTLLAQATFTNETTSGWQQVNFSTPVAIAANTVYVASYHTNVGHYAGDNGFFVTSGVDNAPLHALRDGASGGNGVYVYSSNPAFPSLTYNASNYWVDVVFTPN